jgi:hypothetical protein
VRILELSLNNFRGIKEGSINFKNLNILIGSNNSGKTTILEGLFLTPNPFRRVPYGETAISVLSSLHSTLYSEAYAFLFHNYKDDLASITYSNNSKVKIIFQKEGSLIGVYMEENDKTYFLGRLSRDSKREEYDNLRECERENGKLRAKLSLLNIPTTDFISKTIGETIYFHPLLMKHIWNYFSYNWVEFRNAGLTSKIAKKISEAVAGEYDDLLLEPFIGNQQAIYVRTKDSRGIRLGDLGSGVQVLVTLMLLYEFIKPEILLIDDIESHMNPTLLIHSTSWFENVLRNGTKLIISTHSLEATKFIAGSLEEYKPQITLLALNNGILKSRNFSLEEIENLEKKGIDARVSEGILI